MLRWRRATVVAALAAVLAVASAPGSQAARAVTPALGAGSGTVGIPVPLTVVAPSAAGQSVVLVLSLGGVPQGQVVVPVDGAGRGTVSWLPPAAGSWSAAGTGAAAAASPVAFAVAPVPTRTVLEVPQAVGIGLPTTMVAVVEATGGAFTPRGTVTFGDPYGNVLGSAPVVSAGVGRVAATFTWTPQVLGTIPLVATFTPAGGTAASSLPSSTSDQVYAYTSLPLVIMRLPRTFTQGVPTTLQALVSDPLLVGSSAFLLAANGVTTSLAGSTPTSNGSVTIPWTPTAAGNGFLTVEFSATNANVAGAFTQAIVVRPPPVADPMSVALPGAGVLAVTSTPSVPGGTSLPVTTSSGSGAAVGLVASAPCLLRGSTLVTPSAGGTCTLTASTPGAGAFGPGQATFPLVVTAR